MFHFTIFRITIKKTISVWNKAGIPVREKYHCIKKLSELHKSLKNINKTIQRTTQNSIEKFNTFKSNLSHLFDIAHADALTIIKRDNVRNYLINQREGREGVLVEQPINFIKKKKIKQKKLIYVNVMPESLLLKTKLLQVMKKMKLKIKEI